MSSCVVREKPRVFQVRVDRGHRTEQSHSPRDGREIGERGAVGLSSTPAATGL